MPTAFDASKEARRASRGRWPIARFRLGEEPLDGLSAVTTVAERIAMMWVLAESAWKVAARPLPDIGRAALTP